MVSMRKNWCRRLFKRFLVYLISYEISIASMFSRESGPALAFFKLVPSFGMFIEILIHAYCRQVHAVY